MCGTMAGSMVGGNGVVINGAVAGNYTSIDTSGAALVGLVAGDAEADG